MKRGRLPLVILLLAALLLNGMLQSLVRGKRDQIVPPRVSLSHLSGVDSFTMGLILGGLRGPLVIALWVSVENQKADRDLQNIDTMIELIRMLQPEFDPVHMFQIWNKAYNMSVQMTALSNKYAVILDALDYGRRVDDERPDNIHVLYSLADVYFQKLGQSSEKRYYTERLREDTKASNRPATPTGQSTVIRQRHDSLLTADGRILPELLKPRLAVPWGEYNSAKLQFLEPFSKADGFPYGVPPMALAYNYYKRCQTLMRATTQRHAQVSDSMMDSRPAIALKYWSISEDEEALRNECAAFGRKAPESRTGLDKVAADVAIGSAFPDNSGKTRQAVEQAIFGFGRSHEISMQGLVEYQRHISEKMFSADVSIYRSHVEEVQAVADMTAGDQAYLRLVAAQANLIPLKAGETSEQLRSSARKSYELARDQCYRIMLFINVDDSIALKVYPKVTFEKLGKALTKQELWRADPALYPLLKNEAVAEAAKTPRLPGWDDVEEYLNYISRAETRLALLK